jgi:hypothetical protein
MKQFLVLGLVTLGLLRPVAAGWCEGRTATAFGPATPPDRGLRAMVTTSELVVGQNRFAFGLLKEHHVLDEADVVVRVYELHGQQAQLTAQLRAPYAKLEIVEHGKHVHLHPDGTRHVHSEATDVRGICVTQVTFERPGLWGLEVLAKQGDGPIEVLRLTVNVHAAPSTPAPGTPAPRSHYLIASDVQDLRQIDTSDPQTRGCIRSALRRRSRRGGHRSSCLPRRGFVPGGSAGPWWMSCGRSCRRIAIGSSLHTRRSGRTPQRAGSSPRWRNGAYRPSRGSSSSMARGSSGPNSKG